MLVGLVAIAVSVSLSLVVHWPVPAVHDEFCYLIGADTFARGRLTNPTHPMWEHFESFHMIYHPTYQMKYPPGQAIFLAAGQRLGHPMIGVWLSLAAACAATCWMLQGWVPPRWALGGALLPLLNEEFLTGWGQTYWGGAVAMLGGALTFGALRRIIREPRISTSVIFAAGIGILANTRPYEGAVAVACAPFFLLPCWLQRGTNRAEWLCRVALPAAVVVTATGTWMAYYNYRITGNPLRMPYQIWAETYSRSGSLAGTLFSSAASAREGAIRRKIPFPNRPSDDDRSDVQGSDRSAEQTRKPRVLRKILDQIRFFLGPVLVVPLLAWPWLWQNRWTRFALLTCLIVLLALVLQSTWGHPHYIAPVYPLLLVVVVQGCRHLRLWSVRGIPIGRWYGAALPLLLIIVFAADLAAWAKRPVMPFHAWSLDRADLLSMLQKRGGEHLVVVRYSPNHNPLREWVYNEHSDIDAAPVIWARELSPEQNRRLLEYYANRQIWLLEPDKTPPRLTRHPR